MESKTILLEQITTINELKAMAYDQIAVKEQADNNLKNINERIAQLVSGTAAPKVPENKVESGEPETNESAGTDAQPEGDGEPQA